MTVCIGESLQSCQEGVIAHDQKTVAMERLGHGIGKDNLSDMLHRE